MLVNSLIVATVISVVCLSVVVVGQKQISSSSTSNKNNKVNCKNKKCTQKEKE